MASKHRRAYLKYRDRQRLQKEEDRRTIEELHSRLSQLECERSDLERRVELLQKVRLRAAALRPPGYRASAACRRLASTDRNSPRRQVAPARKSAWVSATSCGRSASCISAASWGLRFMTHDVTT